MAKFETLEIVQRNSTCHVYLNRPSVSNALSRDFFIEFPKLLSLLDLDPNVGCIVLSGNGNNFCSGIDLSTLSSITGNDESEDRGRSGERLRREIKGLQDAVTAIERCRKPVIAGVHGACIGGGIDIITACDIRFCTQDAFFSVKEVDLGLAADLGSLQRLPSIVGYANSVELALTARRFSGSEAKQLGLVSQVFASKSAMDEALTAIAENIAAKPPLAVVGTKRVLLTSRDMSLDQGLDYVATWNSAVLVSDDLREAVSAQREKRKPSFAKL
jgi:delta(3,5)-delta(2,4)-dienoyl-CoA isomerase